MKIIFLDFDGVLHSHYGAESALWFFLPRFESVLRDYPDVQLVVSSSWGVTRSVDELRAFFSPDIASRVIDKVPTQQRRMNPWGERGEACARFCRRDRFRAGDWLAIDDAPSLFHKTHPLVYCINGFRERREFVLRMAVSGEIPAWRFAFEAVEQLLDLEFDLDSVRTREHVLTYRPDQGEGRTIAELLFARRRRPVEKHLALLDYLRPAQSRRTEQEMIERYGYAPEQLRPDWPTRRGEK